MFRLYLRMIPHLLPHTRLHHDKSFTLASAYNQGNSRTRTPAISSAQLRFLQRKLTEQYSPTTGALASALMRVPYLIVTHVCDQQLAAHKQALLATVIQRASTGEEKFKVHARTLGARRRRSYNHTIMSSVAAWMPTFTAPLQD